MSDPGRRLHGRFFPRPPRNPLQHSAQCGRLHLARRPPAQIHRLRRPRRPCCRVKFRPQSLDVPCAPTRAAAPRRRSYNTCTSARRTDRKGRRPPCSITLLDQRLTASPNCCPIASPIISTRVCLVAGSTNAPRGLVPFELEASRVRRNPYLVHRRVGADDEFRGRIFEFDRHRAGVEIGLETVLIASRRQPPVKSSSAASARLRNT